MVIAERVKNYAAIETLAKRPLVVYATSTRNGVPGFMAGDVVREFVDQIDAIKEGNSIDVLIHSTGGDALTAWKRMSMLRERFSSVSVLVPYMAFSAATIFALGADEIVMHPHASLGPIDPLHAVVRAPDGRTLPSQWDIFFRTVNSQVRDDESVVVPGSVPGNSSCLKGVQFKLPGPMVWPVGRYELYVTIAYFGGLFFSRRVQDSCAYWFEADTTVEAVLAQQSADARASNRPRFASVPLRRSES